MGKRILQPGFYHIYNRGYNHQNLFFTPRDYQKFLSNLSKYKKEFQELSIYAYCLLPNHFHLLIHDNSHKTSFNRQGSLSSFMRKLQGAYAMFFNTKYAEKIKKGMKLPVYEGRFQSKIITNDTYLEQLEIYIEWNAVKHNIVDSPKKWPYCSYKIDDSSEDKLKGLGVNFKSLFD